MKKKIFAYIIVTLLAGLYLFVEVPNLNPLYPDGAMFWCFLLTVYILISQIGKFQFRFDLNQLSGTHQSPFSVSRRGTLSKAPFIVVGILWVALIAVHLFSTPLFHVKAYREQLSEPQIKAFDTDMQPIDTSQIPIVDKALAAKLADKKLGEKPALGSQVDLGEPTIQQVNDKLVWIVPLHHSGFFKWLSNMEGTPGYIVVSATDMQDVTYVDSPKVKIHPNAFLMDKLVRRVRLGDGLFTGITDYSFEVDEDGQPYYVVTTYHYLRGFALPEATGVILVNATTGSMEKYAIDQVPEWVDRIQPEDFVMEQINNKGKYIHGLFNFSNFEKFEASDNDIIIYNNGDCYLFTGITSVGSDNSIIGLMLVDLRTKEAIQYTMSGATENAAMNSAEGKVQDLGYRATYPILLNVQSQPTYFMTLKDGEGLVKQYAYVSVKSYDLVGVGTTVAEAKRNYESVIGSLSDSQVESNQTVTATGKIVRIAGEFDGSQMQYSMILDTQPNLIFKVSADKSAELALTKEGDTVTLTYIEQESGVVKANSFDNVEFTQSKAAS